MLDRKNAGIGAIFVGIGSIMALRASQMELGTAFQMGPGYFPMTLSLLLAALGGESSRSSSSFACSMHSLRSPFGGVERCRRAREG